MSENISIVVDGVPRRVASDVTLAAALLGSGVVAFRRESGGNPRAPLCGMGTCLECRVTVDGERDVRACVVTVREGMRIETAR